MPSFSDVTRFFSMMTAPDITIGLAVTAAVLILIGDWRLSLAALAAQYLLVTILLATIVQLQVALVRMLGGGLVILMLFTTAQRIRLEWENRARLAGWTNPGEIAALFEREPFLIGWPFRLLALSLVGVSVVAMATQFPFPNITLLVWLASLWLCSAGLLLMVITRDTLKLGMGLLTFSMGFGVLYLSIDSSLLFFGMLLISELVINLGVSHLAGAPGQAVTRRRGES